MEGLLGLDAYLEDEFGEELDRFIDDGGAFAAAIPSGSADYPMLRYVDVEGVTAFNRLQLAAVIPELERLAQGARPNAQPALARVLKMAKKAAGEPHLYLSLQGD
jgi:hypothetical protein